jgi:hypothetical protein
MTVLSLTGMTVDVAAEVGVYPGAISARHEVITPISGTINLWETRATGRWTRD